MLKTKVIEFLFNGKKYKLERFLLLILFFWVALYLSSVFDISLINIYVPVLIVGLVLILIEITWYNKKKNIKTRGKDWGGLVLCLIVLIVMLFILFKENKLENEVHDVIKDEVQNETFTIESIDEVNYKEDDYIYVRYTVEGDSNEYVGYYYRKDGELVHDVTREIGNEND